VSQLVAALAGAVAGLGALVVFGALRGRSSLVGLVARAGRGRTQSVRIVLAPSATVVAWMATRWPVLAIAVGVATALTPGVGRRRSSVRDEVALVEAIASWTEQVRDTLAGARGLEEAVAATHGRAPAEIASAVQRPVAAVPYRGLPAAMRRFADDVDHPTADFVVAALATAADHEARDLRQLLGRVAQCAREESRMRGRIWVGRARTRSSVRIVASVVAVFILGLATFNRDYLEPYSTASGQAVLAVILGVFVAALWWMARMSRVDVPERFVGVRP
jgi:Flp pilus assembly protein TadB